MTWLDIMGIVANVLGILGAIFAFGAWMKTRWIQSEMQFEKERQNKKITIHLQHGGETYKLPVQLRRAELTRSEVMGHLGMIPMVNKGERFALDFVNTQEFWRHINEIAEGDGDSVLLISCSKQEFEQFDLDHVTV